MMSPAEEDLWESLRVPPRAIDEFMEMRDTIPLAREGAPTKEERALYPQHLSGFYNTYGFEPSNLPADHLGTMFAFMAQIVSREASAINSGGEEGLRDLRRVESRFIRTHLGKALRHLRDAFPCVFTERVLELVELDVALLHDELVGVPASYGGAPWTE